MSAKITTGLYNGQDMYMTEPILDPKRVLVFPEEDSCFEFGKDDLFEFNERCITRKEGDGYVVYTNNMLEYLSPDGFDFLMMLKQSGLFTVSSLSKSLGYEEVELRYVLKKFLDVRAIKRKVT